MGSNHIITNHQLFKEIILLMLVKFHSYKKTKIKKKLSQPLIEKDLKVKGIHNNRKIIIISSNTKGPIPIFQIYK
jgi:hypothetical protein